MRVTLLGSLATTGVVAGMWAFGAARAGAHQSPSACDSNSVDVTPTRDRLLVRNGDVINYTVSIRNVDRDGQAACDLSDATVVLTLPAKDGMPAGRKVTLATGADYPVGTALTFPGTTKWTVDVNPGVHDAVVMVEVNGSLHDAPVDHAATIRKTLGTTVTQPHTTLSVTASPVTGRAPLAVTYTYTEKNDSSTDVPISGVSIVDSNCAPVGFKSGDTNGNQLLDTGETWSFTCAKTYTNAGAVTSNVVGKGTSRVDNRAVDDELAAVTVHVALPHAVLTKSVNPTRGGAPLHATYTYTYTNDGPDPLAELTLADDRCAPVRYVSGDLNRDGIVSPREVWTFSCAQTFSEAGTFPNIVTATAIDTVDHKPIAPLTAHARVVVTAVEAPATIAPATVGTTPPRVLGITLERGPRAPKAPAAPRSGSSLFARTGVRIGAMVLGALALIGLGIALLAAGRRRRAA
jgi:hypothetical protein